MSALIKSFEYSIRYILLIIIFYFLGMKNIYVLNFLMIAIIPVNFLAINYGIFIKIKKDNYVDKYYILMSLIVFSTLFEGLFLYFMKVNIFVIIFSCIVNVIELIFLDLPSKDSNLKIFGLEIVEADKKKK